MRPDRVALALALLLGACGREAPVTPPPSAANAPPQANEAPVALAAPATPSRVVARSGALDQGRPALAWLDDAGLARHGALGTALLQLRVGPPTDGQRLALEAAPDQGAVALADALWHFDPRVRSGAARLLSAVPLQGPEIRAALLRSLRQEPDRDVRALVAGAIVGRSAPAVAPTLTEVLAGDEARQVREAAAWALGTAATETTAAQASAAALTVAMTDADATVRLAAVASLRRLRARDRLEALNAMTRDEDPRVRRAALRAVEDLSGKRRAARGEDR